jgi:hypothetical protein
MAVFLGGWGTEHHSSFSHIKGQQRDFRGYFVMFAIPPACPLESPKELKKHSAGDFDLSAQGGMP